MAIGETPWDCKRASEALQVCPTRAAAKVAQLHRRLEAMATALAALDPTLRPCDLASLLEATLHDAGRLAQADRAAMRRYLETLSRRRRSTPPPAGSPTGRR